MRLGVARGVRLRWPLLLAPLFEDILREHGLDFVPRGQASTHPKQRGGGERYRPSHHRADARNGLGIRQPHEGSDCHEEPRIQQGIDVTSTDTLNDTTTSTFSRAECHGEAVLRLGVFGTRE